MNYSAHATYLILMYMSCCTKFQICYYIGILVLGHHTLTSAFLFKHHRPVCSLFLMASVLLPALWLESVICHSRPVKVFNSCSFSSAGKLTFVHECIFSQIALSDPVNFFPPIQVLLLWKWSTFWQILHPLQLYLINLKFFLHLVSFLVLGAFHTKCYRGCPAALDSLVFCLIHVLVVLVTWVQSYCLLGTCRLQGLFFSVFGLCISTPCVISCPPSSVHVNPALPPFHRALGDDIWLCSAERTLALFPHLANLVSSL